MYRSRDWIIAFLIAFGIALALASPWLARVEGLGVDAVYWLDRLYPGSEKPNADIVVVAIDEETYRRDGFRDTPRVMWTQPMARTLNAILDAEPKVIGFDLIYPTTVDPHVPGFDRAFLRALRRGADAGRIVLSEVQHQELPIRPFAGQRFAVRGAKNIRPANMSPDGDGIIRHYPMAFRTEGKEGVGVLPSLGMELAMRSIGEDDRAKLPPVVPDQFLLNFPDGDAPTYSLADLYDCAVAGRDDFFRTHFAGKTVLLGAVLDVEDRLLSAKRFVNRPEVTSFAPRCLHPVMDGLYTTKFARDTLSGVYIHATAIANLVDRNPLKRAGKTTYWLVAFIAAAFATLVAMRLKPAVGAAVLCFIVGVWILASMAAFRSDLVLPFYVPLMILAGVFAAVSSYRTAVVDQDRRYIRQVLWHYMPPRVMEQLLRQRDLPTLGGESREVTILFMDIVGFTPLSEGLTPSEVARFLNDYLTEMSDIVQAHGGIIEKFVADEITAIFGAPVADAEHAVHAVEAALACQRRLAQMKGAFGLPPDRRIEARCGINTGEMLVGNIGSRRRFTYAAMGDAANLGSRLEGANKFYGSRILIGQRTAELVAERFELRDIDWLLVVRRRRPVRVYTPIAPFGELSDTDRAREDAFRAAMESYRDGDFAAAAAGFTALAKADPIARRFAEFAERYQIEPPPSDWNGVTTLTEK